MWKCRSRCNLMMMIMEFMAERERERADGELAAARMNAHRVNHAF